MVILVFCFILKFFLYFCFQGNMTAFKPTQCLRKNCIKILINMLGMKSCYCFKDFLAGAPRDVLTPSPLLLEAFGTLTMIFLQGTSVWNLPLKNISDPTAFSTSPPPPTPSDVTGPLVYQTDLLLSMCYTPKIHIDSYMDFNKLQESFSFEIWSAIICWTPAFTSFSVERPTVIN